MFRSSSITRAVTRLGGLVVLALVASGCLYFPDAHRTVVSSGGAAQPWYCQGTPAITNAQCERRALDFDFLRFFAHANSTVAVATSAGATPLPSAPPGVGAAFTLASASPTFNPAVPQVVLYAGSAPTDRVAGVAHVVTTGPGAGPPEGYDGAQDVWTEIDAAAGTWMLPVWIVRGYLNQPDVFAADHPCLASGVTLTATTDQCFLDSHTLDLEVLVTNDDGIDAPGIDALVEGLRVVPGVDVTVVAPATNQSGTGDTTSPPGTVTAAPGATASGFAGVAVNGTPGDSVLWALNTELETPDLVVSGINSGQNMGPIVEISGTVGAARIAARANVPSVATSQGLVSGVPADFPSGVTATLDWLEQWRLGLAGAPFMEVANINIPTCTPPSTLNGTVETVVAPDLTGRSYTLQDCTSTVPAGSIIDDVDAFNNGFVGIADVGKD